MAATNQEMTVRTIEYDDAERDDQNERRMLNYTCPDCGGGWNEHHANCPNNEEDESCH